MRSAEHCAKGEEGFDVSVATMTSPIGIYFSHFDGRSS